MNDSLDDKAYALAVMKNGLKAGGLFAVATINVLFYFVWFYFSWTFLMWVLLICAGAFLLAFIATIMLGAVRYVRLKTTGRELSRGE